MRPRQRLAPVLRHPLPQRRTLPPLPVKHLPRQTPSPLQRPLARLAPLCHRWLALILAWLVLTKPRPAVAVLQRLPASLWLMAAP